MISATKMTPRTAMRSRRNRRIQREFQIADTVPAVLLPVPLPALRLVPVAVLPVPRTVPPAPLGVGLDMPLDVERWVSAATGDLLPSIVPDGRVDEAVQNVHRRVYHHDDSGVDH